MWAGGYSLFITSKDYKLALGATLKVGVSLLRRRQWQLRRQVSEDAGADAKHSLPGLLLQLISMSNVCFVAKNMQLVVLLLFLSQCNRPWVTKEASKAGKTNKQIFIYTNDEWCWTVVCNWEQAKIYTWTWQKCSFTFRDKKKRNDEVQSGIWKVTQWSKVWYLSTSMMDWQGNTTRYTNVWCMCIPMTKAWSTSANYITMKICLSPH